MHFNSDYDPSDILKLETFLTEQEKNIQQKTHQFAQSSLRTEVTKSFRQESGFVQAARQIGHLGLYGGQIAQRYGGEVINAVSYGLIARELERVDSGYRTLYSVTGSLVMKAIDAFGSQAQKDTYLKDLSQGKLLGSFALTEPDYGSDTANLQTKAHKHKNGYIITGHKKWIGLAPCADIMIIWAKDEHDQLCAFVVPRVTEGLTTKPIDGKIALRTVPQGEIFLNNVHVSSDQKLPHTKGYRSAFECLNHARYGIGWGALGAAEDCFNIALDYAKSRMVFNQRLIEKQLVQKKLVDMQTEIALGLCACLQVGRMIDRQQANHQMISVLKRNSVQKALQIARDARDILGANGILDSYHIMRHLVNLEAVNTYEGTQDIHTLILGKALSGYAAF